VENKEQLDRIETLIKEVSQRQQELVIPCMNELKTCVFGSGGLKEEVITLRTSVKNAKYFIGVGLALIAAASGFAVLIK
jgi:hypothetical protein